MLLLWDGFILVLCAIQCNFLSSLKPITQIGLDTVSFILWRKIGTCPLCHVVICMFSLVDCHGVMVLLCDNGNKPFSPNWPLITDNTPYYYYYYYYTILHFYYSKNLSSRLSKFNLEQFTNKSNCGAILWWHTVKDVLTAQNLLLHYNNKKIYKKQYVHFMYHFIYTVVLTYWFWHNKRSASATDSRVDNGESHKIDSIDAFV